MSKGLTVLIIAAFLAGMFAGGCSSQGPSGGGSSEASVKPMDEYRQQAEKQISKDNAEAELKKIEAEIESDVAAEAK